MADAPPTEAQVNALYEQAFAEFKSNRLNEALQRLNTIDTLVTRPQDQAEAQNLRGVVLMRLREYDAAEAAFRKAVALEPTLRNASFNLAEIPFRMRNWAEARWRFEVLRNGGDLEKEISQLVDYKIMLTYLLEGDQQTARQIALRLECVDESPASCFAKAALALQHAQEQEAQEWIERATNGYPAALNSLYAESFYEIGWKERPVDASAGGFEIASRDVSAMRADEEGQMNLAKAENAFLQRDCETALQFLDQADQAAPKQSEHFNLRGEILMQEGKLEEAEMAFMRALGANPNLREAQYNLAQVAFKKKEYANARNHLERLFSAARPVENMQAAQLVRFRIFLTLLLEGREVEARQIKDRFTFMSDTPELYYAEAACAFRDGNVGAANDWIDSACRIYSPALNTVFADPFYDLGWLDISRGSGEPLAQRSLPGQSAVDFP